MADQEPAVKPAEEVQPEAAVAVEPAPGPAPLEAEAEAELAELRANEVAFSWQASEYVHHQKGMAWYAGLIGGLVVLSVIAALLQFWLSIGLFVVMGAAAVVYGHRPPRTLLYELTPDGVTIDGRHFPFEKFRSFGVLPDAEWHSIDLEPSKPFDPRMTLLFEDSDFDAIVGHLELHIPRVDRQPDLIDRASRLLRF